MHAWPKMTFSLCYNNAVSSQNQWMNPCECFSQRRFLTKAATYFLRFRIICLFVCQHQLCVFNTIRKSFWPLGDKKQYHTTAHQATNQWRPEDGWYTAGWKCPSVITLVEQLALILLNLWFWRAIKIIDKIIQIKYFGKVWE